MSKRIQIDLRRCIGCHACSVSCKTEHDVPLGSFRTRVRYLQSPQTKQLGFLPTICMQCRDAPCMNVCPTGAIYRRDDRTVDIDSSQCCGNKACLHACPYSAIFINPTTGVAEKCDTCVDRRSHGLDPACVEVCPTDAIKFTDTRVDGTAPVLGHAGTKPQVTYLGLKSWMDKKESVSVQLRDGDEDIIYERR